MSFHLGRLVLPEPSTWTSTGATHVQVVGSYKASSLTDGLVKRDQLLGLADDADLPVIPVTIDNEPRVNGYYRVLGVSFTTDEFVRKQGNLYDYRLDLQPVQGFSQPWLECIVNGALLTNAVGGLAADMMGFHAVPAAAPEYLSPLPSSATMNTRTGADGVLTFANLTGATSVTGTGRYALTPANFYVGAATFEQGSPLQPVIGRTLNQPDIVNWRLSNGLVRVTPNASAGKIDVSHYNGSTWSAVKTYVILQGAGPFTGLVSLTILRNAVEETTIRLSLTPLGVGNITTFDISLRRGDRLARCYLSSNGIAAAAWTLKCNVTEAASAITYAAVTLGGIRATANDADGNRYVLLTYQGGAPTTDLVNGAVSSAAALNADFGIGSEIGGSAAVAPQDAVSLARQYLAAQAERQVVVAR